MRNLFFCVALLPFLSVAQSVTIGEQVFPADAFVDAIGVNTHFAFAGGKNKVWEDFEPLAASVNELGIRYVRDNVRLGNKLDRFNRLYTQYGIRTDVVVFQRGIEPDEVVRRSAEWIETFRKTVDPKAVISFEGPNEYNDTRATRPNWAAEEYRMQEALFKKIRRYPEYDACEIIAPSVWYRIRDDFVALAKTGIDAWCTRGCAHYYSGPDIPSLFHRHPKFDTGKTSPLTDVITDAQRVAPGKPIWVTETGYGYLPDARDGSSWISESSVAKYLPRLLTEWFRSGQVDRLFIYSLVDDVKPYGLLRNNLSKRPAFFAVKNLLGVLADPGPKSPVRPFPCQIKGGHETVHSLVLQKRSGQVDLLLWQEVPSWDRAAKKDLTPPAQTVTITFPRPVSGVILVPGSAPQRGSPRSAFVAQTTLSVAIPDEILLVRINP